MEHVPWQIIATNVRERLKQVGLDPGLLPWDTLGVPSVRRQGTRRMKTLSLTLGTVEETTRFLLWWLETLFDPKWATYETVEPPMVRCVSGYTFVPYTLKWVELNLRAFERRPLVEMLAATLPEHVPGFEVLCAVTQQPDYLVQAERWTGYDRALPLPFCPGLEMAYSKDRPVWQPIKLGMQLDAAQEPERGFVIEANENDAFEGDSCPVLVG